MKPQKKFHSAYLCILFLTLFSGYSFAEDEMILGVLGDSISVGFNAKRYGDNKTLSWSSGDSTTEGVFSHFQRLIQRFNVKVTAYNEAFVGAQSNQLPRQARRLLRVVPDYVTLTIGANDVCLWQDGAESRFQDYEAFVRETFELIIAKNNQVKIIAAPVPDVYRVWEMGRERNCQGRWDTFNICRPLLAPERTQAERLAFRERWRRINHLLEKVSADYPQVYFPKDQVEVPFEWEFVSELDCFHPSVLGQSLMSEKTWDREFIFNP